jgi:2-dehydro-3-deoxyphosphogluconate aldolase/(4S)-4-hydroxy-2-oxoglutarate aldolase
MLNSTLRSLLAKAPVIPVIAIEDRAHALPLAQLLVECGLPLIEITLRTPVAFAAIEEIAKHVPHVAVAAGTVRTADQLKSARNAGARLAISPGWTSDLAAAATGLSYPWLPGVATPTEIMQAMNEGADTFKLFPAKTLGGVETLRAYFGPFPTIKFCPTGGITEPEVPNYLALENVACVGGSWLAPPALLNAQDFDGIRAIAQRTLAAAKTALANR